MPPKGSKKGSKKADPSPVASPRAPAAPSPEDEMRAETTAKWRDIEPALDRMELTVENLRNVERRSFYICLFLSCVVVVVSTGSMLT